MAYVPCATFEGIIVVTSIGEPAQCINTIRSISWLSRGTCTSDHAYIHHHFQKVLFRSHQQSVFLSLRHLVVHFLVPINIDIMSRDQMSTEQLLPSAAVANERGFHIRNPTSGCLSFLHDSTTHIPFRDILWSTGDGATRHITYAARRGHKIQIESTDVIVPEGMDVMALAYPHSKPAPNILVVVNNFGGQGRAGERYRQHILPVLRAARATVTYMETQYARHAVDIGRELDIARYDMVVCCLGDGVPHEIINGFWEREDRATAFDKVAVTQLPCGSGNALLLSTHGSNDATKAALSMLKARRSKIDVMSVTQGTRTRLSFLSQAYGVIADLDIGTEHLRWMGPVRFELGVAQRLISKKKYPCELYVKYAARGSEVVRHFERVRKSNGEEESSEAEQYVVNSSRNGDSVPEPQAPPLSDPVPEDWEKVPAANLSIFYVGKMPYMLSDAQFFPAALPRDGLMDLVITTTDSLFLKMARLLMAVDSGAHVHAPEVHHAKIAAYRLIPLVDPNKNYISVDGESFPVEPMQVEVLPSLLTVLLHEGEYVDTNFAEQK